MTILVIICLAVLWYAIGVIPAILMWRAARDLTLVDLIFIVCIGIFGPISAWACWMTLGPELPNPVIFKRRP